MRKIISILILIVLVCTLCIGFVACNERLDSTIETTDQDGNENKESLNIENKDSSKNDYEERLRLSIGEKNGYFLAKKDFSFGKVSVNTEELVVSRDRTFALMDPCCISYPFKPVPHEIYLEDDTAFNATVQMIQSVYDNHKDKYESLPKELNVRDVVIGAKTYFKMDRYFGLRDGDYQYDKFSEIVSNFTSYEIGDNLCVDNIGFSKDLVCEVYQVSDYHCIYAVAIGVNSVFHNNTDYLRRQDISYLDYTLSFYTLIYKEGWDNFDKVEFVIKLKLDKSYIEGVYAIAMMESSSLYAFEELFYYFATEEERAQIASYYQSIQKEMLTAWLESEQATAYYSENFETKE